MYADLAVDEATGAAATLRRYVFAPGYGSAGLAAWREGGEWCVAHADMLGSTRVVSNGAGAAANGLAYAAFGELATSSAPGNALYKTRYGFCGAWGYESDYLSDGAADPLAAAGLMHVGARYYEPTTGRFVQRDPIGTQGGLNAYCHVSNAPTYAVDPRGLIEFTLANTLGAASLLSTVGGIGYSAASAAGLTPGGWFDFGVEMALTAGGLVGNPLPVAGAIIGGIARGANGAYRGAEAIDDSIRFICWVLQQEQRGGLGW